MLINVSSQCGRGGGGLANTGGCATVGYNFKNAELNPD